MPKLTLSVDAYVVARAKRYAKLHGVSISAMVETYLATVAEPASATADAPSLRSVRGSLKQGETGNYRDHLVAKYR